MNRKNERSKKIKKDAADTNYTCIQTYAFDLLAFCLIMDLKELDKLSLPGCLIFTE